MGTALKTALAVGASLLAGIAIGGYIFSETQRRPAFSLRTRGYRPLNLKELMGLLGSVAINKFPRCIPSVVLETETTVVIKHPKREKRIHYVVIPKKDITDVGALGEEDQPYLIDAFAAIRELIGREQLTNYEVLTNGPGRQTVTYLHFHLMSD